MSGLDCGCANAACTGCGFTWGNVQVIRMASIEGKGKTVTVRAVGKSYDDGITVYISEGGRSVRAFKNGKELR